MPGLLVRTSGWSGQGSPNCFGKLPRLISERGCKGFGDGEIGQGEGGLAWGEGRGCSSDLWQKPASHDAGQESVEVDCERLLSTGKTCRLFAPGTSWFTQASLFWQ